MTDPRPFRLVRTRLGVLALGLAALAAIAAALPSRATAQDDPPKDPITQLTEQVEGLLDDLHALRQERDLAVARAERAERELAELQRFIDDHDVYGPAFDRYRGIIEAERRAAETETRAERRAEYEARQAERQQRYQEALEKRRAERAADERLDRYADDGFRPIGLDVFTSRMSFNYASVDATRGYIEYDPGLGHYPRLFPAAAIDFTRMKISGSVLNGMDGVRNIGVALVFFDESGSQVGHEVVQVNNARPNVPYPFTSTVEMALDRPFTSASSYVLYADPAGGSGATAPASTTSGDTDG